MKKWIPIIAMAVLGVVLGSTAFILCRGYDRWELAQEHTSQLSGSGAVILVWLWSILFVATIILSTIVFGLACLTKWKTQSFATVHYGALFRYTVLTFPLIFTNVYFVWALWHAVPEYMEYCM